MNRWIDVLTHNFANNRQVVGVLLVTNHDPFSPLTDGFDHLILAVTETDCPRLNDHLVTDGNVRIEIRQIDSTGLEQWVLNGQDRRIVEWLMTGEIIMDPKQYLSGLKNKLISFPVSLQEKKLLIEFSQFLGRYQQAKGFLHKGQVLDSYSNILIALHHWARLTIIEQKHHPEVTVWSQVRQMNSGIYKLYEELVNGNDSLQQRIELVLLACEFSVMSKMEQSCSYLLRLIRNSEDGTTAEKLGQDQQLSELGVDVNFLIKKLVKKGLVTEKAEPILERDGLVFYQVRYY